MIPADVNTMLRRYLLGEDAVDSLTMPFCLEAIARVESRRKIPYADANEEEMFLLTRCAATIALADYLCVRENAEEITARAGDFSVTRAPLSERGKDVLRLQREAIADAAHLFADGFNLLRPVRTKRI
jgi:hypothetical protein